MAESSVFRYGRHVFALSTLTLIILPWLNLFGEYFPGGDIRLVAYLIPVGAIHAISLVLALRRHFPIGRKITFALAASAWSFIAPFLAIFMFAGISAIGIQLPQLGLFAILVPASALGAGGYWALVRRYWVPALDTVDLLVTISLCVLATVLSFLAASLVVSQSWIEDLCQRSHGGWRSLRRYIGVKGGGFRTAKIQDLFLTRKRKRTGRIHARITGIPYCACCLSTVRSVNASPCA